MAARAQRFPTNSGAANPEGAVEPLSYTVASQLQDVPIPERVWVVRDWIPDRQVTMLAGDGGTGKSLLAQQLATACALGKDWLGMPTKQVKAFLLLCEDDDDEIHRRQEAINTVYGADFADLEDRLAWFSFVGGDASLAHFPYEGQEPTMLWHRLTNTIMSFGAQLIVLDSLHDVFAGNEIDRVHARGFIRQLYDLAQAVDGAVVLNSHPSLSGRNSGTGESGSTAWGNAVRSRLYLTRPRDELEIDDDARVLRRMKSNYSKVGEELQLTWKDGVLHPVEQVSGAVANIDRHVCDRVFIELLERTEKEGRAVTDNPRTGNYAPKVFSKRPRDLRQGYALIDFIRAMERLFSDGRIECVSYRKPDRKMGTKIARVQQAEMF